MKGGIYHPDQVSIGGNEKYGGIDICDILSAIHEKGAYFNDEAVAPSRPSLYSRVLSCSATYAYASQPGISNEFFSDDILDIDPLWNYNVFCVYQFAIMSQSYPPYIPVFEDEPPEFVLQAAASFNPVNSSKSRTGRIGQRNVGTHGAMDGNVHMPYTLSDAFEWNVNGARDGGVTVYMDMSFVGLPTSTADYVVSYMAKFFIVASNKP